MIIKNILTYFFGSLLMKGSSAFLMPLYIKLLSPAELGLYSLSVNFVVIVSVLMSCGLRQAFWFEYFHCDNDERKVLVNDIIILYLAVALFFLSLFAIVQGYFQPFFFENNVLIIIMLLCFIAFFSELLIQICTYRQEAFRVTLLQSSAAIMQLGLSVVIMAKFPCVIGLLSTVAIAQLYLCAIGFYWYFQKKIYATISFTRAFAQAANYFKLGLPFIPSVLSGWLLASCNRWLLAQMTSLEQVGIYSLIDMFNNLFQMAILMPLGSAYIPFIFNQFATEKENILEIDARNKKYMLCAMSLLFVIGLMTYFCLKPFINWFLPSAYQHVISYLPLALLSNIFLMGTYFTNCLPQFYKKSWELSAALLFAALINIFASYFLIKSFHLAGCAYASLIAQSCYFAICFWYNKSVHTTAAEILVKKFSY